MIKLAAAKLVSEVSAGLYVVGDTPYDAAAALAAGGKPVGTLGGGFSAEQLTRAGACAWLQTSPKCWPCCVRWRDRLVLELGRNRLTLRSTGPTGASAKNATSAG